MKSAFSFLLIVLLAAATANAEIQTDWAYHAVGCSGRMSEPVPGETFTFLANGSDQIPDGDTVTLYVLTAGDFAGALDEQIYVRWWDGYMSHWIMGVWVKKIPLDAARPESTFRGAPDQGTAEIDLWKIDIPAWITQPGENFYAIQLKACAPDTSEERYLLSRPGGDFSRTNNLGQIWSASEEFDGQDWNVNILQ